MTEKKPEPVPRKRRTDALRNRERILGVAKDCFRHLGTDISLDDVAKQAGIGSATLYRHFPTRDALIEAVYRTEVETLAAAERMFARTMQPVEALQSWMLLFVDYIETKEIVAPALNAMAGGPSTVCEGTSLLITGAIEALVTRAIESGEIRSDLNPIDLLRALIGVSNVAASPGWAESAKRLVGILILGSRPVA